MTLTPGTQSPEVKHLQEKLISLGFPLPRWGADGDLGEETLNAAEEFSEALNGTSEQLTAISDELYKLILDTSERVDRIRRPAGYIDYTGLHAGAKRKGDRAWSSITQIVLHQTDCVLGERGNRWVDVPIQVGITRSGSIFHLNPLRALMHHAHALNRHSVGIELDGHYEGVEGDPKTYQDYGTGRKPQTPTPELITAARDAVRWICDEVAAWGGKIELILAHRQGADSRRRDPGSRLWQEIALWAEAQGIAKTASLLVAGKGQRLPDVWSGQKNGVRY